MKMNDESEAGSPINLLKHFQILSVKISGATCYLTNLLPVHHLDLNFGNIMVH